VPYDQDSHISLVRRPLRFILHLLGHETKGSILHRLKELKWATSLLSLSPLVCCGQPDMFRAVNRSHDADGTILYVDTISWIFGHRCQNYFDRFGVPELGKCYSNCIPVRGCSHVAYFLQTLVRLSSCLVLLQIYCLGFTANSPWSRKREFCGGCVCPQSVRR